MRAFCFVLTANGQALAVTNAAIAADFDEPLDVHGDFTPEVALYLAVMINVLSQFVNIRFGQILDPDVGVNAGLAKDVL